MRISLQRTEAQGLLWTVLTEGWPPYLMLFVCSAGCLHLTWLEMLPLDIVM